MSDSISSNHHDVSSGYLNDYTDFDASVTGSHDKRRNSLDTVDTNLTVEDHYASFDRYPKMSDLERVPWGDQEVLNVLREGRNKQFSGHITVEMMQRLSYYLQRPLARIAREAQRLSTTFCRCGRDEIQTAMKIVLFRSLADSCLQACHKAAALFSMSGDTYKMSKSSRCGLRFSVGKFQRWMIDSYVAVRIQEYAAIYMTACMENLLEEIVLQVLAKQQIGKFTSHRQVMGFYVSSGVLLLFFKSKFKLTLGLYLVQLSVGILIVSTLPLHKKKNVSADVPEGDGEMKK